MVFVLLIRFSLSRIALSDTELYFKLRNGIGSFLERLMDAKYNPDVPSGSPRIRQIAVDFMPLVRANELRSPSGMKLMDSFCALSRTSKFESGFKCWFPKFADRKQSSMDFSAMMTPRLNNM